MFTDRPWAISEAGLRDLVRSVALAEKAGPDRLITDDPLAEQPKPAPGVIRLAGPMFDRASPIVRMVGGCVCSEAVASIDEAEADPTVEWIRLDIASGGGMVGGAQALAARIQACSKPTLAYIDPMGGSAAYWIAAACDTIIASPTAVVGSLGVVLIEPADDGEQITIRSSLSPRKQAPADTPDGAAQKQAIADDFAREFLGDVAKHRGFDSPEACAAAYGHGAIFSAREALTRGMVDGLSVTPPTEFPTPAAEAASPPGVSMDTEEKPAAEALAPPGAEAGGEAMTLPEAMKRISELEAQVAALAADDEEDAEPPMDGAEEGVFPDAPPDDDEMAKALAELAAIRVEAKVAEGAWTVAQGKVMQDLFITNRPQFEALAALAKPGDAVRMAVTGDSKAPKTAAPKTPAEAMAQVRTIMTEQRVGLAEATARYTANNPALARLITGGDA